MFELKTILGVGYWRKWNFVALKSAFPPSPFEVLSFLISLRGKNEKLRENVSYFWQLVKDFKHIDNNKIVSAICCK